MPWATQERAIAAVAAGRLYEAKRVDDGDQPHTWTECRTDNNKTAIDPACKPIG